MKDVERCWIIKDVERCWIIKDGIVVLDYEGCREALDYQGGIVVLDYQGCREALDYQGWYSGVGLSRMLERCWII